MGVYNVSTNPATLIKANFITGLKDPVGLAISGNHLFVTEGGLHIPGAGTVAEYNAITGAVINTKFITGLYGAVRLAISGNTLFVSTGYGNTVGAYNATTGAAINANFIKGLSEAGALAVKQPDLGK